MSRNATPDGQELFNGAEAARRCGKNPKRYRDKARKLFPRLEEDKGKRWTLTTAQADEVCRQMA